jgi:hypothetical protein
MRSAIALCHIMGPGQLQGKTTIDRRQTLP